MMALATSIMAGAIGACVGSFIGTSVVRGARAEQPWHGRSHCDACGAGLGFARTIPIISYLGSRGSCGQCRSPIDRVHPAAEVAAVAVSASPFLFLEPAKASLIAGLGLVLLWESLVDVRTGRLPDRLTLACLCFSISLGLWRSWAVLATGLAAAGITFALLEGLRRVFVRTAGGPGLGFGDVKLVTAMAVWLGVATPWVIVLASGAGLLFVAVRGPASRTIPFGPFIAGAAWIVGLVREAQL